MKVSFATVVLAAVYGGASLASAGVVITPIFSNQVVKKLSSDCPYGVVTPIGCG